MCELNLSLSPPKYFGLVVYTSFYLTLIFKEMKTPSVHIVTEPSDPHSVSLPL